MLIGVITLLSLLLSGLLTWTAGGFESLSWLWLLPCGFVGSFLGLVVLAFLLLWFLCAIVDQKKPQEKDSKFYRTLLHLFVDAILPLARVTIKTQGLEKTPKDGRFMLVCNHIDNLDPAFLLTCFRDSQLAFISKREVQGYFLVGKLMHKILCQPINRENDREALKTILKCIQILKEDKASIAVFPEGYESLDGRLLPFRPGVFKIAQKAQVPVVVCTLQGTEYVIRNLKKLKPIPPVQLHLLEVIPAEELAGQTTVQISQRVRELMLADLAEKYQPENQ